MKFEQALRAMRRGEVVRICPRAMPVRIRDGEVQVRDGKCWRIDTSSWTNDAVVFADTWKILRKKKKPATPRFSEDELEPNGTMPRVGDRYVATWSGEVYTVKSVECSGGADGWRLACFIGGEPENKKLCRFRILRCPPEALRDVFKDPRVGDVVLSMWKNRYTVNAVTPEAVLLTNETLPPLALRHPDWQQRPDSANWKVISRAP